MTSGSQDKSWNKPKHLSEFKKKQIGDKTLAETAKF